MIEYKCPKCGSRVLVQCFACIPPKVNYSCTVCEYDHTEAGIKTTITAPYPPEMQGKDMADAALEKIKED
jgi:DNA-directed RNA polymerase subunit RPC12/RpoP